MERFFSLYQVIRKGIISPFLLLILIPQALKIGVDAVVRIPVLFVVKDEIYIKTFLGVGGTSLIAIEVVVDAAFKGVNSKVRTVF